jgi:hypothetical protein
MMTGYGTLNVANLSSILPPLFEKRDRGTYRPSFEIPLNPPLLKGDLKAKFII